MVQFRKVDGVKKMNEGRAHEHRSWVQFSGPPERGRVVSILFYLLFGCCAIVHLLPSPQWKFLTPLETKGFKVFSPPIPDFGSFCLNSRVVGFPSDLAYFSSRILFIRGSFHSPWILCTHLLDLMSHTEHHSPIF